MHFITEHVQIHLCIRSNVYFKCVRRTGISIGSGWLGSLVVRALDSRLHGDGFNFQPSRQILG